MPSKNLAGPEHNFKKYAKLFPEKVPQSKYVVSIYICIGTEFDTEMPF
jgi:hypothetical protein